MRYFMMSFFALGLGLSATGAANAQTASNAESANSAQGAGDQSVEQDNKKNKKKRRVRKRASTRLLGTTGSRERALRKARKRQAKQRKAQREASAQQSVVEQSAVQQSTAQQGPVLPYTPQPTTAQPQPAARSIVRPGGFRVAPVMQLPGLQKVIGADAAGLQRQFGAARLDVREGDARKLQFTGEPCVLDVYLYPPAPGAEPRATYVDARRASDGLDVDRASCVQALAAIR